MSGGSRPSAFYVRWDVGGWNCHKNANSRDAIVILDSGLAVVGKPWRGNLRTHINEAVTADEWMGALFSLCDAHRPDGGVKVTLAIDTPLGFSDAFVRLVTGPDFHAQYGQLEAGPGSLPAASIRFSIALTTSARYGEATRPAVTSNRRRSPPTP